MSSVVLRVNGKQIPLTEFPEQIIKNTIIGMISSFKGIEKIQSVELSFSVNDHNTTLKYL